MNLDKDHRLKTCATKGVQAVERAVAVVEFLGSGELEEWRSIRGISAATGMPESACYRILETLAARGWADKSSKGYRFGSRHFIGLLLYAQDYYQKKLSKVHRLEACATGEN